MYPDKHKHLEATGRSAWELLFIVAIAILPLFSGGGTSQWACGLIFVLLGSLVLIKPPVRSLGLSVNALICAFIALALTSFAPARWFGLPEWRRLATHDSLISLPTTLAPEPWLAAEAALLLFAGIVWLYVVFETQKRSQYFMADVLKIFCIGLASYSAASIFLYWKGTAWPFAGSIALFGSFPNKNQTAQVLAIATLLSIACVYDTGRRSYKSALGWVACSGVSFAGLLLSDSRAGLVVFFIGLTFWLGLILLISRSRMKLVFGAATLSVLLAVFVWFGGDLMERFDPAGRGGMDISQDYRWKIQRDALTMSMTAPVSGSGLGSFEPLFPMFHRALGKMYIENAHPESDLLWLVDEMGWFALVIVLAGGFVLVKAALPLIAQQEYWYFKAAGMAAGLMFFLHGFVDVAGHRMGSFLVAVFAFSFSVPKLPAKVPNPWIPRIFRVLGLILVITGSIWVAATMRGVLLPGKTSLLIANEKAVAANTNFRFAEAFEISTRALRWAPMDWRLYYDRALAEALTNPPNLREARADFLRARFLQPVSPELPYVEGLSLINKVSPAAVLEVWKEALRRTPDEGREESYLKMLNVAKDRPELWDSLRELAGNDRRLVLAFLVAVHPANSLSEIEQLRAADPELDSFSDAEKKLLFTLWARYGDRGALVNEIKAKAKWISVAWPLVVEDLTFDGNYEQAYRLCIRYANLPRVPGFIPGGASSSIIAAEYYLNPQDFRAAYSMYDFYCKAGDLKKASNVINKALSQKDCPAYFNLLKAELLASENQWQEAFESLVQSQHEHP